MMYDQGRIKFIDIGDDFERDEILSNYLKSGIIPKNFYKKAMEGEDMRESFGKEISLSAHTWTSLIFEPYLEKIPKEIDQTKKIINNYYEITLIIQIVMEFKM